MSILIRLVPVISMFILRAPLRLDSSKIIVDPIGPLSPLSMLFVVVCRKVYSGGRISNSDVCRFVGGPGCVACARLQDLLTA